MVVLACREKWITCIYAGLRDTDRVACAGFGPSHNFSEDVPLLLSLVPAIREAFPLIAEHLHFAVRSSHDLTHNFSLEVLELSEVDAFSLAIGGFGARFALFLILLEFFTVAILGRIHSENLDGFVLTCHDKVTVRILANVPDSAGQLQNLLQFA